jgi:hypothetical protein
MTGYEPVLPVHNPDTRSFLAEKMAAYSCFVKYFDRLTILSLKPHNFKLCVGTTENVAGVV